MTMKQDIQVRPLPQGGDVRCSPAEALRTKEAPGGLAAQDRFARMCKAMGHPARVRIVMLLLSVDTCVCGDM